MTTNGDAFIRKGRSSSAARPHTIHTDMNSISPYQINCKYSLLAKDLLLIFQGVSGRILSLSSDFKPKEFVDMFDANDIFFAKRLSQLGHYFKAIRDYSATAMNNDLRGFVYQSFGSALDEEIHNFYKMITTIEANYQSVSFEESDFSLLKLNQWSYEALIRFEGLNTLIQKCRSKKGGAIINVIFDFLHNGDPIVYDCVRKILLKVVKPIRSILNHWIFYGELRDEFKEFFICYNENGQAAHNELWQDKYIINSTMLPGFISKEQANKILLTGKAISMLREVNPSKVAIIIPAYNQLKHSFENSNLVTLFERKSHDNEQDFAALLEEVYKQISMTALNILNAKYTLREHFTAYKRYLLFELGDFISYHLELLTPILGRPSNKIKPYTLSQTLDNVIRRTSAQHDSLEVLSRLDMHLDQHSSKDIDGWSTFSIRYRIDGPISTIFNEPCQQAYLSISRVFWKIKRVEYLINKSWFDTRAVLRLHPVYAVRFKGIVNSFYNDLHQMSSFINAMQCYYNYLIESKWAVLKSELDHPRNLNKLIKVHQVLLQNISKKVFFNNSTTLLKQNEVIIDLCFECIKKLNTFIDQSDDSFIGKFTSESWNDGRAEFEKDIDNNYHFWLLNFNKMFNKEVITWLELLVNTEEEDLRELCFNIDFNKFYKSLAI